MVYHYSNRLCVFNIIVDKFMIKMYVLSVCLRFVFIAYKLDTISQLIYASLFTFFVIYVCVLTSYKRSFVVTYGFQENIT